MGTEFPRIALLGRHADARVEEPMTVLARHLAKAGHDVAAADTLDFDLPATRVPEETLCEAADLAIAIGGDGTLLNASRLARATGTPILGVNRGRLGFLADVTLDEMLDSVDQVLAGNYLKDSRMLLKARLETDRGQDLVAYGLNDVVLQRRGRGGMLDVSTKIAGTYVNTHSGDGLIIATPTGSTAYALSCGGPILEPHIDAIALVPICPHTLSDRPIVIPASQDIKIVLLRREHKRGEVTVDGNHLGSLQPGDRLHVAAAAQRITLLHPPGYDFYSILRSKLFWGRDNRRRGDPGTDS